MRGGVPEWDGVLEWEGVSQLWRLVEGWGGVTGTWQEKSNRRSFDSLWSLRMTRCGVGPWTPTHAAGCADAHGWDTWG